MYSKRTRFWCYSLTLLPVLLGLLLWKTEDFPAALLMTPVLMALTLKLCLYMTEKLEPDKEKNKKINRVVIWIIPVLSNATFWITYGLLYRKMELSMVQVMSWLFGAMYLVLGNYMPKCRPNNIVGIRTKWTASTDENWNATHRLAGPCYMVCGFLMLPGSFLPETAATVCMITLLVLGNAIPMVYSYAFYRKQKRQGVAFQPRPQWGEKLTKAALGVTAAILLLTAVFLCTGSVRYTFQNSAMQVDVTYYGGETISYSKIDTVELRQENIQGSRIWGLGSFRLLAGLFESQELGQYTRMTYTNPHSGIILKTTDGHTYVLSGKDPAETEALYKQILAHTNQA